MVPRLSRVSSRRSRSDERDWARRTIVEITRQIPRPRPLWGVGDVAEYLGVPVKTLYKWRMQHDGPNCLRVGKHLRYVPDDVVAWVESRKQAGS